MSQFLICKSKEKLSKYGSRLNNVVSNRELYDKVIDKYMKNENIDDIWVIDAIHDMVNKLECNLGIIKEIGQRSELMIFWYGSEYEELDEIDSIQLLMNYLYDNINNPCLEIYLYVDLGGQGNKLCISGGENDPSWTREYYEYCKKYVDPRNIPPSVIEDAISSTKGISRNRPDTFIHETADIKIVINSAGKVITVIPKW